VRPSAPNIVFIGTFSRAKEKKKCCQFPAGSRPRSCPHGLAPIENKCPTPSRYPYTGPRWGDTDKITKDLFLDAQMDTKSRIRDADLDGVEWRRALPPFLGEVRLLARNGAPTGIVRPSTAPCHGRVNLQ